MGEVLLRDRLARAGVDATVSSAGLISEGVAASDGSVRAMHKRGLDLGPHRSRPMTEEMVRRADLIVGMAREHVREAVVLAPDRLPHAFTLRELVRRAEAAGPRRLASGIATEGAPGVRLESFDGWLARLSEGRKAAHLLGSNPADDIEDPMGRSRRHYERTAAEIEDLVDRFMAHAFPLTTRVGS
jgi:protein-tyrosine phosphatase